MAEFKRLQSARPCISCGELTYMASPQWQPKPVYCCPAKACRADYVSRIMA